MIFEDFTDTAALIGDLDLAGTAGGDLVTAQLDRRAVKLPWLLNRYDGCWRWLLDRDTASPVSGRPPVSVRSIENSGMGAGHNGCLRQR